MELCEDYTENGKRVDALLRVEESFDLIKKELTVGGRRAVFYYPDGMVDGDAMEKLMIYLLSLKPDVWTGVPGTQAFADAFVRAHLPFIETEVVSDPDGMVRSVLSGVTLMLAEGLERGPHRAVLRCRRSEDANARGTHLCVALLGVLE